MNAIQAFWAFMQQVNAHVGNCYVLTESTHSTPATQHATLFGGNCTQAFQIALQGIYKGWAFVFGS